MFSVLGLKRDNVWEEFRRTFYDMIGEVKSYNIRETSHTERHYKCRIEVMPYRYVFEKQYRDELSTYMIKVTSGPLLDFVRPRIKKEGTLKLKIQTSPWRYQAHFDCVNQWVHMLHGKKRWLLFHLNFDDVEYERLFLEMYKGLGCNAFMRVLQMYGIPHDIKYTCTGDIFFLPRGTYHLTENVGHEGTIFVNVSDENIKMDTITQKFKTLWPLWWCTGSEAFEEASYSVNSAFNA